MIVIFCPKCGGGTYISEEELVKILEETRPLKAVIKVFYVCRACVEKFSRLVHENLEDKKRDISGVNAGLNSSSGYSQQPQQAPTYSRSEDTAAEGLKFF